MSGRSHKPRDPAEVPEAGIGCWHVEEGSVDPSVVGAAAPPRISPSEPARDAFAAGVRINDDVALEHEADALAERALKPGSAPSVKTNDREDVAGR